MEEITLKRTVLNVAGICNLKCRHCLAFIPYYKEKWIMSASEAEKLLNMYFQVVDSVDTFTVTGGEPLLNPEVTDILWKVCNYKDKIVKSMDFVTNSSLAFPAGLLDFFEQNRDHCKVILSDYGKSYSVRLKDIIRDLENRNIPYRISEFDGDNLYYGGWIDFTNHDLKWKTIEERDINSKKCIHSTGKYFVINEGCLHRCSRSYWRMKNGIIPYTKGEYVDLMDESVPLEEKRKDLLVMLNSVSSTSCAYCVGLANDVPRVKPAQQLQQEGCR
ncbi:MAG: radical SAM protein [Lachnospiraceae bacterium]|nr:radical SAM protein [Lachnospiraceae bacterium]